MLRSLIRDLDLDEEYKMRIGIYYEISLSICAVNKQKVKQMATDIVNEIVENAINKKQNTNIGIPMEIFLSLGNYMYERVMGKSEEKQINLNDSIIENYYRVE
jgi:hypothetical protein